MEEIRVSVHTLPINGYATVLGLMGERWVKSIDEISHAI